MKNFYIGLIIIILFSINHTTVAFSTGIALLLGIFLKSFNLIETPNKIKKSKTLFLNTAVVLFAFGLNINKVISIGGSGFLKTLVSLTIVIILGTILAKFLKIESKISQLLIFGTAICGGSAIAATAPIIDANEDEIGISTGVVFLLNTVALFLFTFINMIFKIDYKTFGIWSALSIHDTSSVVATAAIHSDKALQIATIMKLTRTLWIIPIVIVLAILNKKQKKEIKFPIFIIFFILASIVSSFINFPIIYSLLTKIGKIFLAIALYFVGTSIDMKTIKNMGVKSLQFGLILWIISIISGLLITIYI